MLAIKAQKQLFAAALLAAAIVAAFFVLGFFPQGDSSGSAKKTVLIDAGHGGTDTGAVFCGRARIVQGKIICDSAVLLSEAGVALNIALKAKPLLEKNFNVVLTREKDAFLSAEERENIAKKANPALLVSIHTNIAPSIPCDENGFEIWLADSNKSAAFARILEKKVALATGLKSRGFRHSDEPVFYANAANAKLEAGFICNAEEYKKLADSNFQQRFAEAIAESAEEYFLQN